MLRFNANQTALDEPLLPLYGTSFETAPTKPPPAASPWDDAFLEGVRFQQARTSDALRQRGLLVGPRPTLAETRPVPSALRLPLQRWGWALTSVAVSLTAGAAWQIQGYLIPRLDSPPTLRLSLALVPISQLMWVLYEMTTGMWQRRCGEDLTANVARRLGGDASVGDDPRAAKITGTAVNQLEQVVIDYTDLLANVPLQVGSLGTAAYFMSSDAEAMSPWLIASAVGAGLVTTVAACFIQPRLKALSTLQTVRNREQLDDLPAVCGGGSSAAFAGFQARRRRNLGRLWGIQILSCSTDLGTAVLTTGITATAYNALGWLQAHSHTPEQRAAIISAIIASGSIADVVSTIPTMIGAYMQSRTQAAVMEKRLASLTTKNLEQYIDWDNICLTRNGRPASAAMLLHELDADLPAHWRISGDGAVGKTTLLRLLKMYCGEGAALLTDHAGPVMHPAQDAASDCGSQDTADMVLPPGEVVLANLEALLHAEQRETRLLLDSWQQHVNDARQLTRLRERVDALARTKTVVEVARPVAPTMGIRRTKSC